MKRISDLGARVTAALGLTAAVIYLTWRLVWSMSGVALWLSVPAFAVEAISVAGAGLLIWALWPRSTGESRDNSNGGADTLTGDADIIVRVSGQPLDMIRATLLAVRSVRRVTRCIVVDLDARPEVAALAREFDVLYAATDEDDRNGLQVALAAGSAEAFVLLDAGDVPARELVSALAPVFADPTVAVVQGLATTVGDDSPEHDSSGRHELTFERAALNLGLGRRGSAMWLGSGSLVRRDALASVTIDYRPPLAAQWSVSGALLCAGWRIEAVDGPPLVAMPAMREPEQVYDDRVQRARSARLLLTGEHGALRANSLALRQRAALLAWGVRPLSALHRGVFLGVFAASLLAGCLPFRTSNWALLGLWLPAFVCTSLGLWMLSRSTLRPGDRARWSLLTLGAAYRSLGNPQQSSVSRPPSLGFQAVRHGAALVGAVVVISTVMALRGLSDRLTHTLGPLPHRSLVGLMVVGLWVLAMSLDALRLLARRAQLRRSPRVVSSLPAAFGGRGVFVVDLTAHGGGVMSEHEVTIGDTESIEMVMTTASGCTTLQFDAVVRNARLQPQGGWRVGVEFLAMDGSSADALVEYCIVEPARRVLGDLPEFVPLAAQTFVDESLPQRDDGRRMVLRLTALLAVAGAVASVAPAPAEAAGPVGPTRHLVRGSVVVPVEAGEPLPTDTSLGNTSVGDTVPAAQAGSGAVDGLGGALVVGICSLAAGLDGSFGTSDDDYGAPVSTFTDSDGNFELDLDGAACWTSIAPPDGYVVVGDGATATANLPEPVDLATNHPRVKPVVVAVSRPTQVETRPPQAETSATAAIGDVVWHDLDGDGVRRTGEPGVTGVKVTLYDVAGSAVRHGASDSSGKFSFADLSPGLYSLGVSNLPSGMVIADAVRGDDRSTDSDADPVTGRTPLVVLRAGHITTGVDVGIVSAPHASGSTAIATGLPQRVLPAPTAGSTSSQTPERGGVLVIAVLLLAAVLGSSIVLGSTRPRRRA